MIFQGRFDRARKLQKEQQEGKDLAFENENLEGQLEKNDTLALILSALLVFVPAALIVLGLISLIGYFFLVR
ncbi:MAG: hypothetical protein IJ083_11620 [Clostridia bacterium]|nr:hypothetical protein [Clostridia bacterium]